MNSARKWLAGRGWSLTLSLTQIHSLPKALPITQWHPHSTLSPSILSPTLQHSGVEASSLFDGVTTPQKDCVPEI